jgi:hypothetical protein
MYIFGSFMYGEHLCGSLAPFPHFSLAQILFVHRKRERERENSLAIK